jgi:UDP-2-acetamido-3-amino-2,3-dideoxy-glucuronate N-acetyltransferase
VDSTVFIHPAAHVSEGARIGAGTKIWINAQVREGASIGEHCIIGKDTYIDTEVRIGSRVKIQNGVSVYHGVTIEDDVFVGPNATFTNDLVPRAFNADWAITPTAIRRGSSIGANATIVCGHSVGKYAMVGAGSVVTRDVPDHALVVGNPARIVGYVCHCGERLDERNYCGKCKKSVEL